MKIQFTRNKIIGGVAILCILAVAFFWGGDFAASTAQGADHEQVASAEKEGNIQQSAPEDPEEKTPDEAESPEGNNAETAGQDRKLETAKSSEKDPASDIQAAGKPSVPDNTSNSTTEDGKELYCTLSIRCDTLLNNMESLSKGKEELVPANGVVLDSSRVVFYEGESVFNVLQREVKKKKIHMEFVKTPAYNSIYIEGIHNLYEFDCGELSGWMYKVNDIFPGYGSSRYSLKDGDVVEWVYTCDWGRDVGASIGGRQE